MRNGAVGLMVAVLMASAACGAGDGSPLTTEVEKISYAVGLNVGEMLVAQETEIDFPALVEGVRDRMRNAKTRLTLAEAKTVIEKERQQYFRRQQQAALTNSIAGQKFLEENKKRPGVQVTPSGLQFEVVKQGNGLRPACTDIVTFHCKSMFIDGRVFDDTTKRGEPTTFPLTNLIGGWREGIQLMNRGTVARLFVPPQLAYGRAGQPYVKIGPDMTLMFEVELLDFTNAPAATAAAGDTMK